MTSNGESARAGHMETANDRKAIANAVKRPSKTFTSKSTSQRSMFIVHAWIFMLKCGRVFRYCLLYVYLLLYLRPYYIYNTF